MLKILRTEMWKALHNSYFYLALGLGLIVILLNVGQNVIRVQKFTEWTLQGLEAGYASGAHDGFSLFISTLAYNFSANYGTVLYMVVWPILAAMPFAWSYSVERRSGLYNQIVARCGTVQYIFSKYIATFISGGLVVSFTMLADLLLNALVCPYSVLDICDSLSAVSNDMFLPALYYTNPWAHALIWCVVVFFLGGSAAGLAFLVGTKLKLQVLVMLVPFAILIVWNVFYYFVIYAYFWQVLPSLSLSPLELIQAIGGNGNPEWFMALTISLLVVIGLGAGIWQVKHHELV